MPKPLHSDPNPIMPKSRHGKPLKKGQDPTSFGRNTIKTKFDLLRNGTTLMTNQNFKRIASAVSHLTGIPYSAVIQKLQTGGHHVFRSDMNSADAQGRIIHPSQQTIHLQVTYANRGLRGSGIFDWFKSAAKSAVSFFSDPKVQQQATNAFNTVSTALFQPGLESPVPTPANIEYNFAAGPGMPDTKTLFEMNKAAYAGGSGQPVGSWANVKSTPTLQFYQKDNTFVIAVRGTADKMDAIADINIGLQNLRNNDRYLTDLREIQNFQLRYPPISYNYYLTGHSLGGAICDLLIQAGVAKQAITFNPAVEKQFYNTSANKRIYNSDDPLYNMMGKYATKNVEVRTRSNQNAIERTLGNTNVAGKAYGALKAHSLDNFTGGRMPHSMTDRPFMRGPMMGRGQYKLMVERDRQPMVGGFSFFDDIIRPLARVAVPAMSLGTITLEDAEKGNFKPQLDRIPGYVTDSLGKVAQVRSGDPTPLIESFTGSGSGRRYTGIGGSFIEMGSGRYVDDSRPERRGQQVYCMNC